MREDLHIFLVNKIQQYPTIFPTGGEVLHHIFCTNGNGYDWVNGEAKDITGYKYEDYYKTFEDYVKHLPFDIELSPKNEFDQDRYNYQLEAYNKDWKIIEEAPWRANIMTVRSFYPLCEYALICNLPRKGPYELDMTPMWKEALYFMYQILNKRLKTYPYNKEE